MGEGGVIAVSVGADDALNGQRQNEMRSEGGRGQWLGPVASEVELDRHTTTALKVDAARFECV